MPEKFPTPEFSEIESALIEKLRSGDPSSIEELKRWNAEQEAGAMAPEQNISPEDTYRTGVEVAMRKAKLYRAAGLLQEAWNTLDVLQTNAREQNMRDDFETAGKLMDEIEEEDRQKNQ